MIINISNVQWQYNSNDDNDIRSMIHTYPFKLKPPLFEILNGRLD